MWMNQWYHSCELLLVWLWSWTILFRKDTLNWILVIPTTDRLTGIFMSGNMTSRRTSYDVVGNENADSLLVCYCKRVSTNGLSQHYDCHYRVGQLNITKIGVARRKLQFKNTWYIVSQAGLWLSELNMLRFLNYNIIVARMYMFWENITLSSAQ